MFDFHSHILPGIDDGSRSVEESIALIDRLSRQNVSEVFATPHFYPLRNTPSRFFARREASYQKLCAALEKRDDLNVNIRLGAEVAYFSGISRTDVLFDMRIENTEFLLVEMPESKWSEHTVGEIVDIAASKDITPVIAHIERCMKFQSNDVLEKILSEGVLFQANASFFVKLFTRKKALGMLKDKKIAFLGSDCHNLHTRPPIIGDAMKIIEKRLGKDVETYMQNLKERFTIKTTV